MSINKDKPAMIITTDNNARTYVFDRQQDMLVRADFRARLWQIIPSICASLICIPFGIMLGWPSPTYIVLLSETSPLPITMVQSPLIAGLLMFGYIFATPLSHKPAFATKYSLLLSITAIAAGWTIMWQATNLYMLLVSRFIIGFGNGYGLGQIKQYIKELCDVDRAHNLTRCINMFMIGGIVIAYCMGPFMGFREFSLGVIMVSMVIFLVCLLLPHTPQEQIRLKNVKAARGMLRKTKPFVDADEEIYGYAIAVEEVGMWQFVKSNEYRDEMLLVTMMTFVQQFTGAPATIVYCQFIFRALKIPNEGYWAVSYGVTLLLANVVGTFFVARLNKKWSLFISCLSVLIVTVVNILTIYYEINLRWPYISLVVMLVYIAVHSLGLATVPFTFVDYLFPKRARNSATKVQLMLYCFMAVISTKLFQVFYSVFEFYMCFCLFAGVATFGCVFILVFIPKKSPLEP